MDISGLTSDLNELVSILARLRSTDGCPWDREQTHSSLKRFLLEEAYEVFEAIDQGVPQRLLEELGDVLLQVLFHAQIAREAGEFAITDILTALREKLVRRHPHVFGGTKVEDARTVKTNWERQKYREKENRSIIGHIPTTLPSLARSQLIQDRASSAGFEWKDIDGVLEKVAEEISEIREARSTHRKDEEFGDLLMVLVNFGRWIGINAEDSLRKANARFTKRFSKMESLAHERSLDFIELPLGVKESLWQEAKK